MRECLRVHRMLHVVSLLHTWRMGALEDTMRMSHNVVGRRIALVVFVSRT